VKEIEFSLKQSLRQVKVYDVLITKVTLESGIVLSC